MPGLFGIIGKQRPASCRSELAQMAAAMRYDSVYDTGTYSNSASGVYIGWTSHSIGSSDSLVQIDPRRDVYLFLSGDVFPSESFPSLSNSDFHSHSHVTDNIIRLYELEAEAFIGKLNGCFCGLLLDNHQKKAFLFNDRYGMHRLFVAEGKDSIYFSSEAKALLAVLPEVRRFDIEGLFEFLACGCTLGDHSLFEGIRVLTPGTALVFNNGVKQGDFATAHTGALNSASLDSHSFFEQFIVSFAGAVRKQSGGSESVGISLTGGLDSRMVMACLNGRPGAHPCYTFASMYRETFDVRAARDVAKACKQPFEAVILGEGFLEKLPEYLESAVYISDGYIGLSGAAELYLNRLARSIAPIRLTGNYGSELLRGVRAFKFIKPQGGFLRPEFISHLKIAKESLDELKLLNPLDFVLKVQVGLQGYGRWRIEESQLRPRTPFLDDDVVNLLSRASKDSLNGIQLAFATIGRYHSELLDIPTDKGYLGTGARLEKELVRAYREFLFKMEYWSSYGTPSWLMALVGEPFQRFLNRNFLGRHKFQHFSLWGRYRFADYFRSLFNEELDQFEDFFNAGVINRMLQDHIQCNANYTYEIDKLLTLILINRLFIKGYALPKVMPSSEAGMPSFQVPEL